MISCSTMKRVSPSLFISLNLAKISSVKEGARPEEGKRVTLPLTLRVNRVDLQPENDRLRVGGFVVEAPEKYGLIGDHHTINLELNRRANARI